MSSSLSISIILHRKHVEQETLSQTRALNSFPLNFERLPSKLGAYCSILRWHCISSYYTRLHPLSLVPYIRRGPEVFQDLWRALGPSTGHLRGPLGAVVLAGLLLAHPRCEWLSCSRFRVGLAPTRNQHHNYDHPHGDVLLLRAKGSGNLNCSHLGQATKPFKSGDHALDSSTAKKILRLYIST